MTILDLELNDNYIIAATNAQGVFRFPLSNLNLSTDSYILSFGDNMRHLSKIIKQ